MSLPDTKGCIASHYFRNNSVETPEERIEIGLLQYKVQRTAPYAATTPTVSTVFHSKPRRRNFMQTWLHWTSQHAQPVLKEYQALFTQSLMDIYVAAVISMLQNNTPLPTA